ncbi:MAG: FtsX-like permease family protein [Candidatus Latescibacteria bacterium]|nr:FtsX-like permease family protein [Candidatus Latescibacterota bacterium]
MIQHLFKLVWNRKRTNALIAVEIFFSFLILFAITAFGFYYADNYRRPPGFSSENVWVIEFNYPNWSQEVPATVRRLFLSLKDFEEVESCAGASVTLVPYSNSRAAYDIEYKGRKADTQTGEGTDGLEKVLDMELIQGRWFEKGDDALKWKPAIINQRLSRELFGSEDPLGKTIGDYTGRVVGVISDFRRNGEFSEPGNLAIRRVSLNDSALVSSKGFGLPSNILIKVRPGTRAAFEEKLMAKLQAIAQGWTFHIRPMSQMRASYLKLRLAPLIGVGLVAAFLILMVGLGLMGVLWQNVTQRTKEIGLRRSSGATAQDIYRQIIGELLAITTLGILAGTLVIVQFPLLKLFSFLSAQVTIISLAISIGFMYLLTVLCGLYPARLATRIQPAEALHYE